MSDQVRRSVLGTLLLTSLFLTGAMAPELGARELPCCDSNDRSVTILVHGMMKSKSGAT